MLQKHNRHILARETQSSLQKQVLRQTGLPNHCIQGSGHDVVAHLVGGDCNEENFTITFAPVNRVAPFAFAVQLESMPCNDLNNFAKRAFQTWHGTSKLA